MTHRSDGIKFPFPRAAVGVRQTQTPELQTADLQTCRLADLQICGLADTFETHGEGGR